MTRDTLFLQLLADDLRSLHASARALEKDLRRLALEIEADSIESLAARIAQINEAGFTPIERLLSKAGLSAVGDSGEEVPRFTMSGVLAEAAENARRAEARPLGTASAISIMRRSARYMELSCSSVADSAMRLRLDDLAEHLRAWAREWIGLELTLNNLAARPREAVFAAA